MGQGERRRELTEGMKSERAIEEGKRRKSKRSEREKEKNKGLKEARRESERE